MAIRFFVSPVDHQGANLYIAPSGVQMGPSGFDFGCPGRPDERWPEWPVPRGAPVRTAHTHGAINTSSSFRPKKNFFFLFNDMI